MNLRRISLWLIIFGFWISAISGLGCGRSAEIPAYDLSNKGEIQGKVYDLSASNVYASKLVLISGAKVYAGTFEVTAGADGSYKLSGIPAGEVLITATAEGFLPQTLAVNRSTVNIYLSGGSSTSESGSATITGTIYGLPSGVTLVYGLASSLLKRSSDFSYNSSLYKYILTNAPDDGETYLFAYYLSSEAGTSRNIYTYTNLDMTSGTKEVNLDFATSVSTLAVNAILPSFYKYPTLYINIYDGFRSVKEMYSRTQTQETTFLVSSLPALQAGDSYGIYVSTHSTAEVMTKFLYKYNVKNNSTVEMDLTTVPKLNLSAPVDGASFSSNPTFSWEPIADDGVVYVVCLSRAVDPYANINVWFGLTKGSSITLPIAVSLTSGTYQWQVNAICHSNLDIADVGLTASQSYINWHLLSGLRGFTYAK